MKELIELSREINRRSIAGKAVVKSQKRGRSIFHSGTPTGIYYEGSALPRKLQDYIASTDCEVLSIWSSKGKTKAFISPEHY